MTPEQIPDFLWPLALAIPLLLAAAVIPEALRSFALALAPLAALPALGLALFAEPGEASGVEIPWLIFGTSLGLDATTRVFLAFTALLWTLAGLYARSYLKGDAKKHRFFAFYLVTMTGNLGLILARDLASFYLFFTLMSLTVYGLVVHDGTDKARYAAKVYLILAVLGEAFVLPAVLLTAATTGSNDLEGLAVGVAASQARDAIVALALIGFGVKAGALPLHMWLPLAYQAAPAPASAVLSGAMAKAGLLGWMIFLPVGEATSYGWGVSLMVAGLAAAFYGVVVGLTQEESKTILAYSSISQMGLMTIALGAGLTSPGSWSLALTAILVYATHHALAKGALFLGVGVAEKAEETRRRWQRLLVVAGLLLAALAISGAPLTSGAAAKEYLASAEKLPPAPWPELLYPLLQAAAVGSTLLMGRFLFSVWPEKGEKSERLAPGFWLPWAIPTLGVIGMLPFLPEPLVELPGLVLSFSALWPVTLGALLVGGAWLLDRRTEGRVLARIKPEIPEGDLLVPFVWLLDRLRQGWIAYVLSAWKHLSGRLSSRLERPRGEFGRLRSATTELEFWMQYWTVAGALYLLLAIALLAIVALT